MTVIIAMAAVSLVSFGFGLWGWRHAEELALTMARPGDRVKKRRQMRRGAACFLFAAAFLSVQTALRLLGITI